MAYAELFWHPVVEWREEMNQELIDKIPSESPLVNEQLKEQLKGVLDKLNKDLELVTVMESGNEACGEMGAFLKAIAALNSHLKVKFLVRGENPMIENTINTSLLPVVGFYQNGRYLGVAFHGVPGGKEINSFTLAMYNAAGPGQAVEEEILKKVGKLRKQNNLKVCVSLSCHHCPNVVTAGQRLALLSPNVVCEMVDARLYPELTAKFKITRVPAVLVNDSALYMGEKDMEELLALMK